MKGVKTIKKAKSRRSGVHEGDENHKEWKIGKKWRSSSE